MCIDSLSVKVRYFSGYNLMLADCSSFTDGQTLEWLVEHIAI